MSPSGNRQQIGLPDLQPCCDSELDVDLTTVLPWNWFIQIWKWRPPVLPKRPSHPPTLQGVTRKTASWNITSVKILDESNKWTSTDVYSERSGGLSLMRCFCTVFSVLNAPINLCIYMLTWGSCRGCMKRVLTVYFVRRPRNTYFTPALWRHFWKIQVHESKTKIRVFFCCQSSIHTDNLITPGPCQLLATKRLLTSEM
jgi:hypothetical protein